MPETREHVLLTVLSTNPDSAHYNVDARDTEAQVAPAALELLPEAERPARMVALSVRTVPSGHNGAGHHLGARSGWPVASGNLRIPALQ